MWKNNLMFYVQNIKRVYRARPADICLKITVLDEGENFLKIFNFNFFYTSNENQELNCVNLSKFENKRKLQANCFVDVLL